MSSEVKNTLRKFEFPLCAKEALRYIENLIASRSKQNLASQLTSEFIFLERLKEDSRKSQTAQTLPSSQMNSFQEFQLILIFIDYFSQCTTETPQNGVFLSLFGTNLTQHRAKLLCHMIGTAISGSVATVLTFAGAWMQQAGCTTTAILELVQNVVDDFLSYSCKTSEYVKRIPKVAPHFAVIFMTSVTDLYINEQRDKLMIPPPNILLDIFTDWITENSTLHLIPEISSMQSTTKNKPFAGLIRWSILAPLVANQHTYSNLHLGLLKCLPLLISNGSPPVLYTQDLNQIVESIQNYTLQLKAKKKKVQNDTPYLKCMERFAQTIQIALNSKCIFGDTQQLLGALQTLPRTFLMDIVITENKSNRNL